MDFWDCHLDRDWKPYLGEYFKTMNWPNPTVTHWKKLEKKSSLTNFFISNHGFSIVYLAYVLDDSIKKFEISFGRTGKHNHKYNY